MPFNQLDSRAGPRNHALDVEHIGAPGEYDGMICAAVAMRTVATITVVTSSLVLPVSYISFPRSPSLAVVKVAHKIN